MAEAEICPELQDARSRILVAALSVFAEVGFAGASLRQIAERASVMHQLVVYHFKTKEGLWRAAVGDLLEQASAGEAWRAGLERLEPVDALRRLVQGFVSFTAQHPQFHRITTFEGQADTPRFRWLVETYVTPMFRRSTRLIQAAQASGSARAGDPAELHYGMIGLVTTRLVLALEYRMVTGVDPFARTEIERLTAAACEFLGLPSA